ncbi:hypothetical protein HanHA300_Chr17g0654191 [Helianthus annuus]|nr:hypothetical protein HanHA300_Chr17g0654191 [Helianthus annuus]KAJ0447516.1 hypothetical protein HanHA89_Chr17g0706281 [Helianthus annuus]
MQVIFWDLRTVMDQKKKKKKKKSFFLGYLRPRIHKQHSTIIQF